MEFASRSVPETTIILIYSCHEVGLLASSDSAPLLNDGKFRNMAGLFGHGNDEDNFSHTS